MIFDVAKRLRQAPTSQWLNKNATYFNSHSVPLGYMQLQQGMSDVFSLLGFCEIAKRFFKILVFNREWFAQKLDMYG